jgi:hypothetical protein
MYFNVTHILAVLLPFEKQQTGSQSWAGAAEAVEKNSVLRSICSVHRDRVL